MERSIADFDAKIHNYTAWSFAHKTNEFQALRSTFAHNTHISRFDDYNEIKIKRTSDFSRFFPTFTEVCFPFEDPGRSLLVAGPRFRLAMSSALSPTLALSDKSVSPFTLVTAKEKNYTENSRGSFTLISTLTNRSCWERFQSYRYEWNISSSRASEQLTNLFQL